MQKVTRSILVVSNLVIFLLQVAKSKEFLLCDLPSHSDISFFHMPTLSRKSQEYILKQDLVGFKNVCTVGGCTNETQADDAVDANGDLISWRAKCQIHADKSNYAGKRWKQGQNLLGKCSEGCGAFVREGKVGAFVRCDRCDFYDMFGKHFGIASATIDDIGSVALVLRKITQDDARRIIGTDLKCDATGTSLFSGSNTEQNTKANIDHDKVYGNVGRYLGKLSAAANNMKFVLGEALLGHLQQERKDAKWTLLER
jgi:hypothetical protein